MKKLITFPAAVLSFFLSVCAVKAIAQDAPIMALDPTLMAGWTGNLAISSGSAGKSVSAAKTSFPYRSTAALRQSVVSDFVKRLQSQSPKGAQAVASAFGPGKTDYGTIYAQMLKTSALKDNDAADALAGFFLVGYQIVNNVPDEKVTPSMERAARAQVADILSKTNKLSSATTRARAAEEIKLQTIVMALGLQETLKNNTVESYRKTIASTYQNQYHINLYQLQLTNRGFVKK